MARHLENKNAFFLLRRTWWIAHAYQTMEETTGAHSCSQCGNEGRGGDELVDVNVAMWMPSRRGPRTQRDQPQSTLFRFQRFPTRTTLRGGVVAGERGLSVMGLWLKVADQNENLLDADFTRVLSGCAYFINRDNPAFLTLLLTAPTSSCHPDPSIKPIGAPKSGVQTSVTLRSR